MECEGSNDEKLVENIKKNKNKKCSFLLKKIYHNIQNRKKSAQYFPRINSSHFFIDFFYIHIMCEFLFNFFLCRTVICVE